jgi:hypothetical protein
METKQELITHIKDWIQIDNDILELKKKIKVQNNKKKILSQSLLNTMKTNKIDCFDINGGSLVYKQNKVKKPINGKTLLAALKSYYNDESATAENITKHILDNREEHIKETIKRKIDK